MSLRNSKDTTTSTKQVSAFRFPPKPHILSDLSPPVDIFLQHRIISSNEVERHFMVQPLRIDQIQKNYQADLNWRLRRHPQITTNYELARDTVIINRLTQRQSVNVP